MFNISIEPNIAGFEEHITDAMRPYCLGKIVIGNEIINLHITVDEWSPHDYLRQWNFAIDRMISRSCSKAALVISANPPSIAMSLEIYGMWRMNQDIVFQQLVIDIDNAPSCQRDYSESIPSYTKYSVDGDMILHTFSISDHHLRDFMSQNRQ